MPRNNSKSARAYRRGEALKRRLRNLGQWSGLERKDPFISNGKFIDPEKKIKIAEQDIANIETKHHPLMVTHAGGQTEYLHSIDAPANN